MGETLKAYGDWLLIFEKENNIKVIDDDGARMLHRENRLDELLSKEEAFKYFIECTIAMKL